MVSDTDGPMFDNALAEPGQAMQFGIIGGGEALAELVGSIPGLQVARQTDADGGEWRQIINPNLIDALVIDVAPAWRASMIQDALAVGVPVLCIGALANDSSEVAMIKRLSGMGGGLVMAWYPWLFNPAFAAMNEIGGMVGPVRAIRITSHVPANLGGADLIWSAGADGVAAVLEMLGGPPEYASAEAIEDGVLLRLLYKDDVNAHIELRGNRPDTHSFAVHRDQLVMRWTAAGGLRLHPPTQNFAAPTDEGEQIAGVDPGGPETAVRTFAHMILERDPQPQILDFAADVVKVLESCAKSL
ncbi:MAG: hypothetical protein WCZ23_03145 [Rhodospirillaceae bacterium]